MESKTNRTRWTWIAALLAALTLAAGCGSGGGGSDIPPLPAITMVKTAAPTTYASAGAVIDYSYELTNTGNVALDGPFTVTDDKAAVTCPADTTLAAGAFLTCTASYTITQADITAGSVTNTAQGHGSYNGNPVDSNTDSATVTATAPAPALTLLATDAPTTYGSAGVVIGYSYQLTNTGNVPLAGPFTVTDDKALVTCPADTTLAMGAFLTCTASYTTTQADYDAGSVTHTATGHGAYNSLPVDSNTDTGTATATGQAPALALVATAAPTTFGSAGTVIDFSYQLTNSGNVTLAGPFTVTDDKAAVTCPATTSLAPAAALTCTASYTTTQADYDAGSVTHTSQGHGLFNAAPVNSNTDVGTVTALGQAPALALAVTALPSTFPSAGTAINFSYQLTNSGNVTLAGPFTVTDDRAADEACPATASLAPGGTITCTGSYTTTQADFDAGSVTHTSTGHGLFSAAPVNSNTDTGTVAAAPPAPALTLAVTAAPTTYGSANTVIGYSYQLTNSGNVTLAGPFTVTDDRAADEACPATASLAPGGTITCTGSYTTTQADYDAGSVTDTATGHAAFGGNPVNSNTAGATATATGRAPALALAVTAAPTTFSSAGTVIGYSYQLTNSGNVTLAGPFTVTDDRAADEACPATASLAPGGTITCTGSYTTTQADYDAGSVTDTATGHAAFGGNPVDSNTAAATVTALGQAPALALAVTAAPTTFPSAGTVIGYSYQLTNSGNVTLAGPFTVTDDRATDEACPATASLAPGGTITCTGSYTTTQADYNAGSVTNTASGHAAFNSLAVDSNTAAATVTASVTALTLAVTAAPPTYGSAGATIAYSYQLTNSGNVPLDGPFTVTDDRAADEACPATASLAPGGTITCTGSYTITQADYDAGSVTNTAVGHGSYNATPVDSNTATATVTATGQAPALALRVTASPTIYASAGTVIGYSYQLANAGNVSLAGPFTVTDDRVAVTCPADTALAVGAFVTCTGSYTTTQADITAGSVTNTAQGHGSYNGSPVDSNIAGVTITVGLPKTRVIVANGDDDSVSLVSLDTMSVLATIPLSGAFPWEISVSPDQTKAYVSCRGTRNAVDPGGIAVVDLVTQAETAYITGLSGIDPAQSVVVGNTLYVVYSEAAPAPYISAVDLSVTPPVESAVLTLPTLNGALSIAATHDGGRLYVGTWNEGIYSVDITQVPAVITNIGAPISGLNDFIHDLSIDAAGILYAATEGDDLVERYDTVTGVWLDGVAHAFPDGLFYLHGVEAAGNLIFAAETWDAGGFSVMTETGVGNWAAVYVPAVFPFDHDMDPVTPAVPVSGLLHGLALAENYAVAPVAMDFDYAVTQDRLAVLDRQTLAVTFITVGLGPRAAEVYSATTVQPAPALALAVTAAPTTFSSAGTVIGYSYQLTNTGNVPLAGPFTVTDDKAADEACPATASLAPGGTITCTGSYTTTQADFDAGSVTNTASGHAAYNGTPVDSNTGSATVAATVGPAPALTLAVTAAPTTFPSAGTVIDYSYQLTNTGNVALAGPFTVTDDKALVTCPADATLAVGAFVTCTASYTTTQADYDAGLVTHTSTGHGSYNGTPVDSNTDVGTSTATGQTPALALAVTAAPTTYTAGTVIGYSYQLTNSGNVTLAGPFTVTDDKALVTCPADAALAVGAFLTCTGTYTATQADLIAGSVTNTATGQGFYNGTPVNSAPASATVTATAAPALALSVTAAPTTFTSAGTQINYSYRLANSGNVPLAGTFTVTDDKAAVTCPNNPTLAVGAFMTCTGTYTTTQADLTAGSVTNTAVGHGFFNGSPVNSAPAAATVTATVNPALALVVTAAPTTFPSAGTLIAYSYQLTNSGNVALAGPFTVTDDSAADEACPATTALAPGGAITCTGSYTITQADFDAGSVTATATGHGFYNGSPLDSNIVATTVTSTGAKTHVIVANGDDDSVSIVSLNTMTVEATIPLTGTFPWEVSVSPDRTKAYVSCRGVGADPGGISVIDLVARTESFYINGLTGTRPSQSVVVGNVLYVIYYERTASTSVTYLSAVDLAANPPAEIAVLTLPNLGGALSIAATPDGAMLYVGTVFDGIYSIDISQVPAVIANIGAPISGLGTFIHDLSVDAAGILHVAAEGDDLIERYDTITGGWALGVAHAFPDLTLYLHGVEADGNRIFAAESWDAGGFSVMTENPGGWSAQFVPTVFPFDHDGLPGTPAVPVTGLLHGLALADGYAVAPVAMDLDYLNVQNLLAVLDRQTLAVTYVTVGMGPRGVEAY